MPQPVQARHKEHRVTYLKSEIEIQAKFPLYQPADFEKLKMEQATEEKEYQAILGRLPQDMELFQYNILKWSFWSSRTNIGFHRDTLNFKIKIFSEVLMHHIS
ncbi:hypothetical protein TNCT_722591 [Trichonephila clavata]|uniref:Uncharacterized protein n=1 Tax=Trichonephila clavata TaxID=2740835 RepID=A0A8X6H8F7_TRICU|nr:hypothetical protein TNCT_722591 [Trichonephila clavata]